MTINDDILYKIDSEIGKDKKVVELQREIERLNQEIRGLNNCIIEFHSEFCNKQAEINRLNNIINELEKWLRSEIKRIEELQNPAKSKVKPYGEEYNNYTLIIGAYDNVLDKLQELKGDDKE